MKRLMERTEIATAINFRKYPVVKIDVSKIDDYGIAGTKVLIENGTFGDGEPYYIRATLRAYNDTKHLTFTCYASGLHADFGYEDIEEMLEYANAPIIKSDQDILVVPIDSEKRVAYAPAVLHTGNHVSAGTVSPLGLEKIYLM